MCGIVGIVSQEPVAAELHDALIHLQHRGQDAAGIITYDTAFHVKRGQGLVREIFNASDIKQLPGNIGIAHVRYPTAGGYSQSDTQPLYINEPIPMALAHNGNLLNYQSIAEGMKGKLQSSLDSEVVLHVFAEALRHCEQSEAIQEKSIDCFVAKNAPRNDEIKQAIKYIFEKIEGSYSIITLIPGKGLIAFRDPHGIRPLVWGERKNKIGTSDYIFASETTSFYALGFEPKGDLAPGEVVFVTEQGELYREVMTSKEFKPCVFEYVYFARPDSTLDGVSVYRARLRMGQNLAKKWKATYPDILPDVVIPVPFTANTSALSLAHELGVRYSEGLYKNPFIGRTFIMPNQSARARSVRYKLTPQRTEIENKKVMIVDDSIVRGTTSREIVKMIKEFGAKEIYLVSSCPPIEYPCFYGIDMPSRNELIAAKYSQQEIRAYLGVDYLLYQTQEDLIEAVTRRGDHQIKQPCMACMDGKYVCGRVNEDKMVMLEQRRALEKESA